MKNKNTILIICLCVSVILNCVLSFLLLKSNLDTNSYEGTWKCTSNPLYEITIFVDHNNNFYEAMFPTETNTSESGITLNIDLPKIVYKGYIENNTIVYTGERILQSGDSFEYLSDIPDELYSEASYYYTINRNSKSTLMLEIPNDSSTKYTFVKIND